MIRAQFARPCGGAGVVGGGRDKNLGRLAVLRVECEIGLDGHQSVGVYRGNAFVGRTPLYGLHVGVLGNGLVGHLQRLSGEDRFGEGLAEDDLLNARALGRYGESGFVGAVVGLDGDRRGALGGVGRIVDHVDVERYGLRGGVLRALGIDRRNGGVAALDADAAILGDLDLLVVRGEDYADGFGMADGEFPGECVAGFATVLVERQRHARNLDGFQADGDFRAHVVVAHRLNDDRRVAQFLSRNEREARAAVEFLLLDVHDLSVRRFERHALVEGVVYEDFEIVVAVARGVADECDPAIDGLVEQQVVDADARFDRYRDRTRGLDFGMGRAAGRDDGFAQAGGMYGAVFVDRGDGVVAGTPKDLSVGGFRRVERSVETAGFADDEFVQRAFRQRELFRLVVDVAVSQPIRVAAGRQGQRGER